MFEPRIVQDGTQRYRLLRPIGRGGMARVYLAEDTLAKTQVAIKFLEQGIRETDEGRTRFIAEMKLLKNLDHPHIAMWYDSGIEVIEDDAHIFMAMELVEGEDLATRLEDLKRAQGGRKVQGSLMAMADILAIGRQLGEALAAVHAQSIVHRDIKPQNIILLEGDDICIKLIDFGVAKQLEKSGLSGSGAVKLDPTSTIIGTPLYLAPEQGCGGEIDHRADIYALGAVLYETLTGEYTAEFNYTNDRELIFELLQLKEPLPPSRYPRALVDGVDPKFEKLLLDLLERDVKKRIQTVEEFLRRLAEIEAEAADRAEVTSRRRKARRPGQRWQSYLPTGFATLLVGVVATLLIAKTGLLSSEDTAASAAEASVAAPAPSLRPPVHAPAPAPPVVVPVSARPLPPTVAALTRKQRDNFLKARAKVQNLPSRAKCPIWEEAVFLDLMAKRGDFPDAWYWGSDCSRRKGDAKQAKSYLATYTEKSGGLRRPR